MLLVFGLYLRFPMLAYSSVRENHLSCLLRGDIADFGSSAVSELSAVAAKEAGKEASRLKVGENRFVSLRTKQVVKDPINERGPREKLGRCIYSDGFRMVLQLVFSSKACCSHPGGFEKRARQLPQGSPKRVYNAPTSLIIGVAPRVAALIFLGLQKS